MREVTAKMVREYKLRELGIDFAGYEWTKDGELSAHHLIIPRRKCKALHIPNDGYCEWNIAVMKQLTSHDYLHLIERYDYDRFLAITSELIDENMRHQLIKESILNIHDILSGFEREYSGSGIIKPEYTRRRVINREIYLPENRGRK